MVLIHFFVQWRCDSKIVEAFADTIFASKAHRNGLHNGISTISFGSTAVYSAYNWQPSPLNYVEKENELTNKFELSTESPSRLRVSGTHRFLPVK